jgi:predicted DNA-binding transcriptional regulator AlpA
MTQMKLIPEKKFRVETLGLSATGFWRLKKAGDLPVPIVIGRRNYYTIESIMLAHYVAKKRSRQTMETLLAALGKFEYAVNNYIELHGIEVPQLDTGALRLEFYARSRKLLRKSSRVFDNRAYPDPVRLIEAIHDGTYQLQASLQYEGGLRTEGVGAPSNRRLKNPLTSEGLHGIGTDPVTGKPMGIARPAGTR